MAQIFCKLTTSFSTVYDNHISVSSHLRICIYIFEKTKKGTSDYKSAGILLIYWIKIAMGQELQNQI